MYLLDTNVVSELRKPENKAAASVVAWVGARSAADLYLSVITVLEIEYGIAMLERRDAPQAERLATWLHDGVLPRFAGRVLVVDVAIARRVARLHAPDPRPERDAFIAGTALVHDLTVVTRNVADFEPTGVRVLNPWQV